MSESPSSSTWSEIAPWYDELLNSGSGPHETALATMLALIPDCLDGSIVDVGCGQGLAARALADRGARSVTGVDAAPAMIEIATRRTLATAPISWRVDDAERLETCRSASFDGAVCQLALMDIGDLDPCLLAIHRVLKRGRWFVFVIGHPCFLAPRASTAPDANGREGRLVSRLLRSGVLAVG